MVTNNKLEEHNKLATEKSLAKFTDFPKIKIDKLEQSSLKELECKIKDTYISYKERTIRRNITEFAKEVIVPCLITSASGAVGVLTHSWIVALSGVAVSCVYKLALKKKSQAKKKFKSS